MQSPSNLKCIWTNAYLIELFDLCSKSFDMHARWFKTAWVFNPSAAGNTCPATDLSKACVCVCECNGRVGEHVHSWVTEAKPALYLGLHSAWLARQPSGIQELIVHVYVIVCVNICMCLCLIQNYVVCDLQTHDFHCRPCQVHYLSKSVQVVHIMHILETLILQRSIKQQSSDESNCQRFPNRQTSQCTGGTGLPLMTSYMLPYSLMQKPTKSPRGLKITSATSWTEAS